MTLAMNNHIANLASNLGSSLQNQSTSLLQTLFEAQVPFNTSGSKTKISATVVLNYSLAESSILVSFLQLQIIF